MTAAIRTLVAVLLGFAVTLPARAHPHVWVTMRTEVIYASQGAVVGIRHAWTFDDMYSAFATQGLPQKTKGVFTRNELAPLAQLNVDSLKDSGYFTHATADGEPVQFDTPTDYWLDYKDAMLTLHFTLPFKQPIKPKTLLIEVYDPTIFVDFEFAKGNAVSSANPPPDCQLAFAGPPDPATIPSKKLSEAFFNSLTAAQNWGAQFANKITVTCR
jgi:ABC-type uncharacterized transport system substrate-binding protein